MGVVDDDDGDDDDVIVALSFNIDCFLTVGFVSSNTCPNSTLPYWPCPIFLRILYLLLMTFFPVFISSTISSLSWSIVKDGFFGFVSFLYAWQLMAISWTSFDVLKMKLVGTTLLKWWTQTNVSFGDVRWRWDLLAAASTLDYETGWCVCVCMLFSLSRLYSFINRKMSQMLKSRDNHVEETTVTIVR